MPKLGEWLQQVPGMTDETSVQKSRVIGKAKALQSDQVSRPLLEDLSLKDKQRPPSGRVGNLFILHI